MRLEYTDHRADPAAWAQQLGISREAVEIYLGSDVIDLHVDSFIWNRIWGYDLRERHGHGALGARFYSQVDFPRILEAQVTGATWVITTNPLRGEEDRPETFVRNVARLREIFAQVSDQFALVRNAAEYRAARAEGKHGAFVGIQGGNALDRDLDALDRIPDDLILRVTLVHLSTSKIGVTSSPLAAAAGGDGGLSDFGRAFVRRLNEKKIFVDLAHVSRKGFFDALEVHDKSQPVLVTHTGIAGVHEHWRNLTDEQVRAVAGLGGTIGVMYQSSFLGDSPLGGKLASIVDHMAHVARLVGDDHISLGSDWDGAIVPPRDMPTCLELPRLVDEMLRRGWKTERIQKALGGNALRVIAALRGLKGVDGAVGGTVVCPSLVETLAALIARDGKLTSPEAAGWVLRLAQRIESTHQQGLVHGNVSGYTVLVEGRSPHAKGILIDSPRQAEAVYYSPERASSGQLSQGDDTWALAVLLFHALTAQFPYQVNSPIDVARAVALGTPKLARHGLNDPALQGLFDRAFARDPSKRVNNATSFIQAVQQWVNNPQITEVDPLEDDDEDAPTMMMQNISIASAQQAGPAAPLAPLPAVRPAAGAPLPAAGGPGLRPAAGAPMPPPAPPPPAPMPMPMPGMPPDPMAAPVGGISPRQAPTMLAMRPPEGPAVPAGAVLAEGPPAKGQLAKLAIGWAVVTFGVAIVEYMVLSRM